MTQNLQLAKSVHGMGQLPETRGKRAKSIRDDLGDEQEPFAERFNARARTLGLDAELDQWKVSRTEKGRRPITLDDAVVFASLDPKQRGLEWFAMGEAAVVRGPATQGELEQMLGTRNLAPRDVSRAGKSAAKKAAGGKRQR